jgi:hypothetical protein
MTTEKLVGWVERSDTHHQQDWGCDCCNDAAIRFVVMAGLDPAIHALTQRK